MSFHATPAHVPIQGQLRTDRVTLSWDVDGVMINASHLNDPLHFGEGAIMSAQLSTSMRAAGRRWWLLASGEPEPWIHLVVRLRRGIRITLSAQAEDGDDPDALPDLEHAGYRVPIDTLRALFQTAEALGARTSHRQAQPHDAPAGAEVANFTPATSPVHWPPELEPPPDPPDTWEVLHKEDIRALAFAPDASELASVAWDGRACIWSMETGTFLRGYDLKTHVDALACSPVETLWAIPQPAKNQMLMVRGEHASVRPLPHFDVRSLAFSSDGSMLAAACKKALAIWSIDHHRDPVERPLEAWSVVFSPQGRLFVGVQGGDILDVSPTTGQPRQTFGTVEGGRAIQLEVSVDGRLLAGMRKNRGIWIWDISTQKLRAKINGRTSAICWTPHNVLLSAMDDGTIRIWSFNDPQPSEQILARGVARPQAVAASADGYWFAWGDDKGLVILWDVVRKQHRVAPQQR